jgi:DNA-directed RNA polymerase subunit RPC12/RpoP
MATRKYRCIYCGDEFESDTIEQKLFEEGFITQPDTCTECAEMINNPNFDMEDMISDADPGL